MDKSDKISPDYHVAGLRYGDVRFLPETKDPSIAKRGLKLKQISEFAAGLWTLVLRTVLIGSVLAVLAVTAGEVMRDTILVEEISLPKSLVEMGYSGNVAAHRLWDSTQWINEYANTSKERASLIAASRQIEITEPGTGLSLSGLVQVIRRLLGREQPRIAGEFVCRDLDCAIENMELRIRAFQDGTHKVVGVGRLGTVETEAEIDAYFDRAAMALLELIDPYVRASFLYEFEANNLPEKATVRAEALVRSLPPLPVGSTDPRSVVEANALLRRKHPQRAWAAQLLSYREAELGNEEQALIWASRSVSLMNTDRIAPFPNSYNSWGDSLAALGRHKEAIEKYRAALKIDSGYAPAYNNWGVSLAALGDHEGAIEKYKTALEIEPGQAYAYISWGNRLGALGRHEEAIEKYKVALEIDPSSAGAYNGWGNRLGALGRHEEAIEKYKAALKIDPDYAFAHNGWGKRLRDLGRHEEAIEKYKAALKIDPSYTSAYNGWVNAVDRLVKSYDHDRCAKFASTFPSLEQFADTAVRSAALLNRFAETREACTRSYQ